MASSLSTGPKPPKLLDRVRAAVRFNHYSPRTEQAYVDWIERFIRFHGIRHPQEMGAEEVRACATRFLSTSTFRVPNARVKDTSLTTIFFSTSAA
jgi:hypothetical protein